MTDPELGDPFIQDATAARLQIGKRTYRYVFVDRVADLLRQGFKLSELEYDVFPYDGLMERGHPGGAFAGFRDTGNESDHIRPDVQARMDGRYGVDGWKFVEITDGNGNTIYKPLIKPSDPHK